MVYNTEQIMEYLPHRKPMLLVDSSEMIDEDHVRSWFHINGDEFFLQGHFPGYPVVPGVILCEIMAQSCVLILGDGLKGHTPFYAGLDKVRFKNQVRPGDTVEVLAHKIAIRGNLYILGAEARVDGKLCAKAEMTFFLQKNEQ